MHFRDMPSYWLWLAGFQVAVLALLAWFWGWPFLVLLLIALGWDLWKAASCARRARLP